MRSDVRLIRSPLSVAGMVLTTLSAVLFLVVFLADLFGLHTNPYLGILFFLVLPASFGFGLIAVTWGTGTAFLVGAGIAAVACLMLLKVRPRGAIA